MPAIDLVDRVKAIQYTGSNSAEINGLISDFTITSEGAGVLHFDSGGTPFTANTDDWVRYTQGYVINVHDTSSLNFLFIRNIVYDEAVALVSATAGLQSAGVKEAPLLIVGNTTVAVDIIPAMPDTSYTPLAQLFASTAILGPLTIASVTVVDVDTVNVVINNGGLIGISGARVLVTVPA